MDDLWLDLERGGRGNLRPRGSEENLNLSGGLSLSNTQSVIISQVAVDIFSSRINATLSRTFPFA
jgi:hypothetical protein